MAGATVGTKDLALAKIRLQRIRAISASKELAFLLQEYGTRDALADLLGGDLAGRYIRCPSPGRAPTDRSCWVAIDPSHPGDFYVYHHDGPLNAAKARIVSLLGLLAHVKKPTDNTKAIESWENALPAPGSLVERYLRGRGILLTVPPAIRFHPRLRRSDHMGPAMVAALTKTEGSITGLHQTWLASDGSDKAPLEEPREFSGQAKGAFIQLAPLAETLAIGEGIETCLSFMQLYDIPTWSAHSTWGLKTVELPDKVRRVLIVVDGDPPGHAAAVVAADRFRRQGRTVRFYRAPWGKDFNNLLMTGNI